jgi:predicted secreted protein
MSANVINGTDLCLFITSGATKKCIALATTCKISTTMSTRKIASKDSGVWEESAVGRMSWSCDTDNLFTQDAISSSAYTYDNLFDLVISRTPVVVSFGMVTTSGMGYPQTIGSKYLSGTALITKLDLNAKDNDNSSFTVTLEGTGALART